MCGRFTLTTPAEIIADLFGLQAPTELAPRYNIAPTQPVAAVRSAAGGRELAQLRWGLIPSWAADPAIGNRLINARAETVAEKPAFRAAFGRRRCLIPADGFYEWKKAGRAKQPYLIRRPDGDPFAMAGLWESWRNPAGETVESCTIITTEANTRIRAIHGRMPVVLAPDGYGLWLDAGIDDRARLQDLLAPCPDEELMPVAVSTHVNNPRNDDPRCRKPLAD